MEFHELYAGIEMMEFFEQNDEYLARADDRLHRRQLRDASDPFSMAAREFINQFRVPVAMAKFIVGRVAPTLRRQRVIGLSPELQVLAALSFYARGSYQDNVGNLSFLTMSQPSVSRCVTSVSAALCEELANEWIRFPCDVVAQQQIKERIMQRYGMPGVIGLIDCTHISIVGPTEAQNGFLYFNRKQRYSINTQIVCDDKLKILSISATHPGSVHDAAIWQVSEVRNFLVEQQRQSAVIGPWLLGDAGYPLEPWLLTPFPNPATAAERKYNESHTSARAGIERCNGVLKQRFRCLLGHRVLHYRPERAQKIIYACAILHNMCMHINLPYIEQPNVDNVVEDVDDDPVLQEAMREGRLVRDRVAARYF